MAILVSPGALTRELDFSLYAPSLSTSILAMVGTASKGPINQVLLITSVNQLAKAVGGPSATHPAILTAHLYFQRGRQLKFVRVGNPDDLEMSEVEVPTSGAGSAVVQGSEAQPFVISASTPGQVTGTEVGPYLITDPTPAVVTGSATETFDVQTGTNNKLSISIDGGDPIEITLTAGGTQSAQDVVDDINAAFLTEDAPAEAEVSSGRVRISTTTSNGTGSTIEFNAIADDAYTLLGLSVGSNAGTPGNDKLLLAIDGGSDQLVNLAAGAARTAQQVVDEINAQTNGVTASVVTNKVRLTSNSTGQSSSVQVKSVLNSVYTALGLTTGTNSGTDGTDLLVVEVNGGGDQSITLPAGSWTAAQIVSAINDELTSATASVLAGNRVQLASNDTGSSRSIQVKSSSTADTVLGFDNDVETGTDAGAEAFTVMASSAGTWGDRLQVRVMDGTLAGTKTIVVLERGVTQEVHKNLSKNPSDSNFYETVINGKSEYITIENNSGTSSQPSNGLYDLSGGSDGLIGLNDSHFIGTDTGGTRTGLQLFADSSTIDVNIVAAPGRDSMNVHAAMISMCESRGDAMCICDPPQGLNPQQVVDFLKGQGAWNGVRTTLNSSYAAMYYPWVKVYDSLNAEVVELPPSAAAIRAYALTDVIADPWYAAAGLTRGRITEAVGIERTLTQGERDYLYENRINPIANFPNEGITIWGQKTLQSLPSALDRVNVRRMMLYIRKVIATAVVGLVFDQNTPRLWRRFVNLVTPPIRDIKNREGIVEYKIICDANTNPPEVVDRNEFRAQIFIKPTKTAEFIIVDFVLVSQASTFNETLG